MVFLFEVLSNSDYRPVVLKYLQKFFSGEGAIYGWYEDKDICDLIIQTNEVKNKVKEFGERFGLKLQDANGRIEDVSEFILPDESRFIFNTNWDLLAGTTILINDVSQVSYHLQSFSIGPEGDGRGTFYVEVIDHFGLDDADPQKKLKNIVQYQNLGSGFAAWWILQHMRDYKPFRTRIRFLVCLDGKINY